MTGPLKRRSLLRNHSMNDAAYFLAALPEPRRVLGVELKPLTLGHRLILQRAECSFVLGTEATFADLVLGVAVCSRSYAAALRFLTPGLSERIWLRWRGIVTWLAVKRGYNLPAAAEAFRDYIAEACRMPHFSYEENDKAKPIRAPADAVLKVALQESLGYSADEALNLPYGQAIYEHLISNARKGHIELVDEAWEDTYNRLQHSSQEEIDRMISAHLKCTGKERN